jgi:hypothetical protein
MQVLSALLYVVLAAAIQLPADSDLGWNKKSTLSTDRPVEFPGIVLEPGTYVIKLVETSESLSKIQILNQDESQVLGAVVAVQDHRVRPEDQSEFVFHDVQGTGPQPVRSWFYTGDLVGLEFVYPHVRAQEISRITNTYVMASNGKKDAMIVAILPNGKELVLDDRATQIARRKAQ